MTCNRLRSRAAERQKDRPTVTMRPGPELHTFRVPPGKVETRGLAATRLASGIQKAIQRSFANSQQSGGQYRVALASVIGLGHGPGFCFLHGDDAQLLSQRDQIFLWAFVSAFTAFRFCTTSFLFSHLYLFPRSILLSIARLWNRKMPKAFGLMFSNYAA